MEYKERGSVDVQWGTEETQFVPKLSGFLRDKGRWDCQSTVVRKVSEELPFPTTVF